MLIGGDDISKDIITLGTSFSTFVYIRVRFRFALIGRNLYTTRNDPRPQMIPKFFHTRPQMIPEKLSKSNGKTFPSRG